MTKYIFLILMLISSAASAKDPCAVTHDYVPIQERYEKGLLFALKKCGQTTSYIFGTMHSDSPDLLQLLKPVKKVLSKANSANFEIKSGQDQTMAALHAMYFPITGTKTLISVIGLDFYRELQEFMAKERPDIPEISFQRMRPWAVAVLLQYPETKGDGVHVDLRLENYAKTKKIPVYGLETAKEQLRFFEELSQKDSVEFLRETIDNYYESSR